MSPVDLHRTVAVAGVLLVVATVAGCGGGSRPSAQEILQRDPVALATHYGEAAITCDMAHQMTAVGWQGGWTAYPSQVTEEFLRRQQERRARRALVACRRDVEPGSRVEATLVSEAGDRAVVAVRTLGPSGRGRTVRMHFFNDGPSSHASDRWSRVR